MTPELHDVRSLAALWRFRQRRHVVIACADEAADYEALRPALAGLNAELVVERVPGPLSQVLGRPSVTVADRFGSVGFTAGAASVDRILRELEGFELVCPECGPQAWGDPTR